MKYLLIIVFIVLLPAIATAEEYTKGDFAFGYILETDNQGAIYSVTLPHEVYVGTVMGDLEDMRVFNSESQIVPHELRYPTTNDDTLKSSVSLPFFPFFSQNKNSDSELSMRIETGSRGEIVNIQRSSGVSGETPSAYLIDMNDTGPYPIALKLQWKSEGSGTLLPVVLESSEDLISWRRIKQATLADLVFMNNRLRHGEIELSQKPGRYVRLKSENQTTLPEITAVDTISSPESKKIERRWIELPLRLHLKDDKTYLQAEITGGLPMDGLNIEFNQPNSLLKARVLSLDSQDKWRYQGEGVFYLLTDKGNELRNEPLFIKRQNISTLRLQVIEDGVGEKLESTLVKIGYVPQELLFIARGSGPFTLAYGNGRMQNDALRSKGIFLGGLAENGQQGILRKAKVREKVVLGGKELLDVPKPNPWKKRILWLVLLIGVATLASMAWSLTRKMNR